MLDTLYGSTRRSWMTGVNAKRMIRCRGSGMRRRHSQRQIHITKRRILRPLKPLPILPTVLSYLFRADANTTDEFALVQDCKHSSLAHERSCLQVRLPQGQSKHPNPYPQQNIRFHHAGRPLWLASPGYHPSYLSSESVVVFLPSAQGHDNVRANLRPVGMSVNSCGRRYGGTGWRTLLSAHWCILERRSVDICRRR